MDVSVEPVDQEESVDKKDNFSKILSKIAQIRDDMVFFTLFC